MATWRRASRSCPSDKVRLSVDVPSADVQHAVEHAANDLAASLKIPGFRKGKVPMPVLRRPRRQGADLRPRRSRATSAAGTGRAVAGSRIRPASLARVRLRAARLARERLQLHGDRRRPAEARARRLDAARGAGARAEVPEELVDARARGAPQRRSPSSSPSRAAPAGEGDVARDRPRQRVRRGQPRRRRRARCRTARRGARAGARRHVRRARRRSIEYELGDERRRPASTVDA